MTADASPAGTRRPIRRLDPQTIERIAAGEVVERPASVVKELLENALDAGATEVRVTVARGGIDAIRVDDDGVGIPKEELPLALERHATSKLAGPDDLDAIATLGFRGEALAAIAAVARVTLTSRTRDADAAYALEAAGGAPGPVRAAARPPGTTVEARELFFNTPARQKFLRSAAAEQVEVAATVERIHLARPDVAIVLATERGEIGRYVRALDLGDAANRVFGPEFATGSFPVSGALPGGGRLEGVLGRPALARSHSTSLFVAVNRRAVASRPIAQAVRAAFQDHLGRARFPIGVLALILPPGRVDPNAHPTKREVRFADERALAESIRLLVRDALLGDAPAAPPGPAGAPAPPAPRPGPTASEGRGRQRSFEGVAPPASVAPSAHHPALRLLGSIGRLYWVAERDDGALLIDQHAASERVLFDALLAHGRIGRQELLHPTVVLLSAREKAALEAHAEAVRAAGFDVAPFGGDRYRVRAVPSYLGRRLGAEALRPLLAEIADGGRPTVPDGLAERVAASIACHAAVRAGDVVSPEEFGQIVERLFARSEPAYACPHGRPIVVEVRRARLDRWFLRPTP